MATTNKVQFIVEAVDKASDTLKKVDTQVDNLSTNAVSKFGKISNVIKENQAGYATLGVGAGLAVNSIINISNNAVEANKDLQNSFTGLKSIVEGTGNDFGKAKSFINEFTADGLVTAGEAATSLKNLLAKGFNLKEASDLMYRFKDAAAFGRQSTLGLGEAIQGAAEGIKNENSMLVDNAGITKNVAAMQEDYAKSIGKSYKELTEAEKRTAVYNGIMEESKFQVGDAAKMSEGLAGQQAKLRAQNLQLQQSIGNALTPAYTAMYSVITPIITAFSNWSNENPKLSSAIIITTATVLGLTAALVAFGFILGPITVAITAIGATIAAIGAPILIAIAAVGGLFIAYQTNFLGIQDITNQVFGYIGDFLISTWNSISRTLLNAWNIIKVGFDLFINGIKFRWETLFNGMKLFLEGILIAIGLIFGLAFQLITGDFTGFINNIKAIWEFTWNAIKAFGEFVWNSITKFLTSSWNNIKNIFSITWDFIKNFSAAIWEGIKENILKVVDFLSMFFTSEGHKKITEGFKTMFGSIGDIAKSIFQGVLNTVILFVNKAIDLLNEAIQAANNIPGVSIPLIPQIPKVEFRAKGGPVDDGNPYIVGEKGPELFVPNGSGQIIPNNKLNSGSGMGSGNKIEIILSGNNFYGDDQSFIDKIGDTISQKIQQNLAINSF